jgi:hypothetical protein
MMKQLSDVTIVFAFTENPDEGAIPYTTSRVIRVDYEGDVDDFLRELKTLKGIVHID